VTVPAVILAAGAGTRFGAEAKLLADLDGRPVVAHVVAAARAARAVGRIVVVVGARAGDVRAAVEGEGVEVVECPGWEEGQAASLRRGLAAAGDAERVLVLVGDQPGVTAEAIDRLAREPPGSRAAYGGRPGHPAVLGRELVRAAAAVRGDRGLRDVAAWRLVECGDVASGRDVDTPEDLASLREAGR
jgi:molybdenum cofactor cytidylyltransferase